LMIAVTSFMSELPSGLGLIEFELLGLCRHVFYAGHDTGTYRQGHFAVFMPPPDRLEHCEKSGVS
jgi:hypothetical protein